MLLDFRAKNYKSFKEELVFSLVPAPKQKGLDYSILQTKIGKKTYKALCSAVIYGPNASGKTNIIGAMDTFKSIVIRGHIRDDDETNDPNPAAKKLGLIPNITNTDRPPVEFSIKFIEGKLLIEYAFSVDLGHFLEADYERNVLTETLKINEKLVFSRDKDLIFGSLDYIQEFLVNSYAKYAESLIAIAKGNLNHEELFLTNGFKTMFSSKIVEFIIKWLENKFFVIYRADSMYLIQKLNDPKKGSIYINKILNEAAVHFGINSNALGYAVRGDNNEARLYSLFDRKDKGLAVPAEIFESFGTLRLIDRFPLIVDTLKNGGTLVVDEFDASIHPMALMSIINIFHNDEINIHNAQLVFNTHNPIFLNANLFRRDEIKFVERDENTHCSTHYSLSDFGTAGKAGVRKNEDYMKNYFVDRYGAIKDIDFTPIFENLADSENQV